MSDSGMRLLGAVVTGVFLFSPAWADDDVQAARDKVEESIIADEQNATDCVSIRRIDRTEIIDDRTVVFHMLGKDIYLNKLPRRCPGLRSSGTYSYKNQTGRLCDVDTITVLNSFGGGFSRGASCGLGKFFPITKDELVVLKNPELDVEPETTEAEIEEPEES